MSLEMVCLILHLKPTSFRNRLNDRVPALAASLDDHCSERLAVLIEKWVNEWEVIRC